MEWKDGKLVKTTIYAIKGGKFSVSVQGISKGNFKLKKGDSKVITGM